MSVPSLSWQTFCPQRFLVFVPSLSWQNNAFSVWQNQNRRCFAHTYRSCVSSATVISRVGRSSAKDCHVASPRGSAPSCRNGYCVFLSRACLESAFFPCVCPEPVLVEGSFLDLKTQVGQKTFFFLPPSRSTRCTARNLA